MMKAYNKTNLMKIADAISKGKHDLGNISTYGLTILRFILVKYSGRVQTE
jgi:hypothetical protein